MAKSTPLQSAFRPLVVTGGQDILRGLAKWRLWTGLGWREIRVRYRRTVIGPFWTSINLAIYVAGVGVVGAGLWSQPLRQYLPFLVGGMVVWALISTIIRESCSLFLSGPGLLREVSFEYSILAYALVWRNFVVFLHNLIVYFGVCLILAPETLQLTILLALPGLFIVLANGVWVSLLSGMICLRYRDVQQLVTNLVQIAVFVTPIFWPPESLKGPAQHFFVDLNPFFHMIDIVRGPMLGRIPGLESYVASMTIAIAGWAMTMLVFNRFRRRIAYWS